MTAQTTLSFDSATPATTDKADSSSGTKNVVAYINLSLIDKNGKTHSLTDRKLKQYASIALSGDSTIVQAILSKKKTFASEEDFATWFTKSILLSFQEVSPKGEIEL